MKTLVTNSHSQRAASNENVRRVRGLGSANYIAAARPTQIEVIVVSILSILFRAILFRLFRADIKGFPNSPGWPIRIAFARRFRLLMAIF